jgi:ATP-dependent protease ClpP protease subunit
MKFPSSIFKKSGAVYNFQRRDNGAEVLLYDALGREGVTSKQFIQDLQAMQGEDVTLRINSPGGDVFEGVAIYNALRSYAGRVHVVVDSLAASAASVVAMAGGDIVMAANAMMMIHDPFTLTIGTADDHRRQSDLLDQVAEPLVAAYVEQTGASATRIRQMMKAETWMDAPTALRLGFADEIASPDVQPAAAAEFDLSVYGQVPECLKVAGDDTQGREKPPGDQVTQADIERALRQTLGLPKVAARRVAHGAWKELSTNTPPAESQAAAEVAAYIQTLAKQI